jgi:predicted transcriptional regulator of viral defense system
MSVAQITRDFIEQVDSAKLFTYDDIPIDNKKTVAIELSRLYKKGIINKVSKGKFYKPKKRAFGDMQPSSKEKILSYFNSDDEVSYETGLNSFRQLGLTTQVASTTTIATNKSYRQIEIDNIKLKFIPKRVDVTKEDIYLVQILDALKDIKKIPATTPQKAFVYLKNLIQKESKQRQKKLAKYALKYTPRTRALLGAILKELGLWQEAFELKETLNPLTSFKIGLDLETLPTKKYWNII